MAGNGTLIKGEVGIGFASSSNSSNSSGSTAVGSTINGGGNVTLKATEGDLHSERFKELIRESQRILGAENVFILSSKKGK